MDREILKERLLILTDNQIKEILEKYQYLQEIEILPDIIVDKEYFVYNNRRGQYKVKSTLPVSNIMDKMIIGKDIILATHKELILLDRKNPSESKVIFKVNEARTFIYYTNDIILMKYDGYIEALEYKNGKIKYLEITLKINNRSYYDIGISQNDIIIAGSSLYKFDTKKGNFILVKEDRESAFISIGRKNKIVREITEENRKYSTYLYDADTDSNILLASDINAHLISQISENHILMDNKLYRYTGDNIIFVADYIYIAFNLSNSLYYDSDPHEKTTKLLKSTNLMLDYKLIKEFDRDFHIVSIPLSSKTLKKRYNRYQKLIPMVNTNIKNLILEFCRGDT